jgi:hypothetical protein
VRAVSVTMAMSSRQPSSPCKTMPVGGAREASSAGQAMARVTRCAGAVFAHTFCHLGIIRHDVEDFALFVGWLVGRSFSPLQRRVVVRQQPQVPQEMSASAFHLPEFAMHLHVPR